MTTAKSVPTWKRSMALLTLRTASSLLGHVVVPVRHGLAHGMRRRVGLGFRPRAGLTPEETFLLSLELRGKTVFDVGAYVGMVTLFFSRAVGPSGRVVAFEPHPRNYRELRQNVVLNGRRNVALRSVAVGEGSGVLELLGDPLFPARGTLAEQRKPALRQRGAAQVTRVSVVCLDEVVASGRVPPPDFVKIDTEGFECAVAKGMEETLERHRPTLFAEMHGADARCLVSFLLARGYDIRHVEAERPVHDAEDAALGTGHLYCTPGAGRGALDKR